jgi:hypothetical protein
MSKKPKKESKLKGFARQYRHRWIGGYLYIESPYICTEYVKAVNWSPHHEELAELRTDLDKVGITITDGCVYDKVHRCYYVVSHLWLLMLPIWAPKEMNMYVTDIFQTMLSKVFMDTLKVKTYPTVNTMPTIFEPVKQEVVKSVLLDKVKEEVVLDEFYDRNGISFDAYTEMRKNDRIDWLEFEKETPILDFFKVMWNRYRVTLKEIMAVLRDVYIINQDLNDPQAHYRYTLNKLYVTQGWGRNEENTEKGTLYPVLTRKGLFNILSILHEKGILQPYVLVELV